MTMPVISNGARNLSLLLFSKVETQKARSCRRKFFFDLRVLRAFVVYLPFWYGLNVTA